MPKIKAPATTSAEALNLAAGAQYYRFTGIEFAPAGAGLQETSTASIRYYMLRVDGTSGGTTGDTADGVPGSLSEQPNFIQIDRCYIHSWAYNQVCLHGIELFCQNADVCNNYISGFNGQSGDAQGILIPGVGPFNIWNNYVEATGENIMFGRGAYTPSASNGGQLPGSGASGTAQSFVKYNSLVKSDAWRFKSGGGTFQQPTESGNYLVKNLAEVKAGKNITFDHNFLMNTFDELDQHGVALAHNIINYTGWEGAINITWSNNVIVKACAGMYIAWNTEGGTITSANKIQNIKVQNNLFVGMSDSGQYGNLYPPSGQNDGRNFVLDLALIGTTPIQGLIWDHNTFIPAGAPNSLYPGASGSQAVGGSDHAFLIGAWQSGSSGSSATGISGFQFTNNIVPEQGAGFAWAPNGFGGGSNAEDISNWKAMCPSPTMGGNAVYTNNPPFPQPTNPITTASFMSQFDPAHTNYTPGAISSLSLLSGTAQQLSFPSTNGTAVTIQGYALPSGSSFKATDTLINGGLAGCDLSQLVWGPSTPKTSTTTNLSASPTTAGQGVSVTLTATVTGSGGTPTGSVQFFDGGTLLGTSTLSGGTATLSTSAFAVGSNSITAVYSGDSTFAGSTSTVVTVTITGIAVTLTIPAVPAVVAGGNAVITVKATD